MAQILTKQEIYEQMREWRNLKKLHHAARERVAIQDILIKEQAEQIRLLKQENTLQKKMIEMLQLQIEELKTMI